MKTKNSSPDGRKRRSPIKRTPRPKAIHKSVVAKVSPTRAKMVELLPNMYLIHNNELQQIQLAIVHANNIVDELRDVLDQIEKRRAQNGSTA